MFEKFLEKQSVKEETPKKKKAGRPPLPDELRKYPKRKTSNHDHRGRLKPKARKNKQGVAGYKHYKVVRKQRKEYMRRKRAKGHLAKDLAYNKTLRRKYIQNRSVACIAAKRKGIDPDVYYQITYEQWLLLWAEAPSVWHESKWWRPASLASNPLICQYKCCYFDRLDRTKPFEIGNVAVFYRGKPLS